VTVAIACNLSEGVILGVDSAASVPTPWGTKIYETADKLFQLGSLPVGVAVYGLGALGARNVGSYLTEFESTQPKALKNPASMAELVEKLRSFFVDAYDTTMGPIIEQGTGKKISDMTPEELPACGLVVGGFVGKRDYLSEVYHIVIPHHRGPNSAQLARGKGDFGTNWFAMCEPIFRYVKGFDAKLLNAVVEYLLKARGGGVPLTDVEKEELRSVVEGFEYRIPFEGMPLGEGIEHTRFLAELVVSHHRYAVGEQAVGGRVKLGKVTYRGDQFELLDD